jgi:hypothetical protein
MNVRGIQLLLDNGFPAPRKEQIVQDPSEVDMDDLFDGAEKGVTIMIFDRSEPIDQNPLYEKNIHKYGLSREEYLDAWQELNQAMLDKGIKQEDIWVVTHQSYFPDTIAFSGRVALHIDENGEGFFAVDAVESLRKCNTDFNPSFTFVCPVKQGKLIREEEKYYKKEIDFPQDLLERMMVDIFKLKGSPYIDFSTYKDNGDLFYHDLFFAKNNNHIEKK